MVRRRTPTGMAAQKSTRKYDILVLGATGYTGAQTVDHIAQHLPTELKWAIAGRSRTKLDALAAKVKSLSPERSQPAVEVVDFGDRKQLDAVVGDAKVCISVVLYHEVGEVVVQACVENGTDYIDTLGNAPLIRAFIEKYHEAAVKAGVALIHACGFFTAPQDLLAWAVARELQEKASAKTNEVILIVPNIPLEPSGGTVTSMIVGSNTDPRTVKEATQPWALSPIPGKQTSTSANFLHIRRDPDLGLLSDSSFHDVVDRVVVHRTWGLLTSAGQEYGPNFQYNEYHRVSSTIAGLFLLAQKFLIEYLLWFGPTRALVKMILPTASGKGPDIEKSLRQPVEIEAIGVADSSDARRAHASFSHPSGSYPVTALFLAQGAASLLYTRSLEGQVAGGSLTPAFLGADLISRIQSAGATFRVNLM
ncbi:Saccharopine dehydrogenase-domain-containing protein [Xylariaceae sp. FL0662B]|nr:Saccharopine dehydrogenase-domain-containing protein [Xylariaceae sp. FL0662B]